MSFTDVIVLVLVILILLSIIFFSFVLPLIKKENPGCSSCPNIKKGKRMLKNYRKENNK